ncbi:AAA family ATPase [Vibrio cholerae]|uniref:AAA family ATPase n=1 Tax=Vibrio cholerae TaxID=666 RepID=UPI0013B3D4F3|nr:AAA family ATPase [Vibrio cholerae]MBJ6954457.1 AAA family ATPase [Vibrio cholerae]GIB05556.1 ABC transporter family protein [Vibrio cholerae]HBC3563764.1 AAA family ATPase [Vibrio cholerae]
MIEYIKIFGLHGEKDVLLRFDSNVKIIIGDNGSGKTTVLGALYAILSLNFHKLGKVEFESIELKFSNGETINLDKDNIGIGRYLELLEHPVLEGINNSISPDDLFELVKVVRSMPYSRVQHLPEFRKISRRSRWTSREIYDRLSYVGDKVIVETDNNSVSDTIKQTIKNNIKGRILYLPTYRRVEEALNKLGYLDDDFNQEEQLIQFGMNDVKARFNKIKSELKETAVKLYTNLNGKMLTQLTSAYKASELEFSKLEKREELRIVLSRVGDSISSQTKDQIMRLIENGDIKRDRYHPLVFVLSNLVDVYLEQKETDDAIKQFVEVANKYLVSKEFVYDENNVDIKIRNIKTGNIVELENLSSGEKQLISLFSMLYLDKADNYIVIFDEPELSLSIEWQESLLPDMLDSGKCNFLVAATHSPFIFENSLDNKTGIIEVIREG